jgi:hypothetical protein
MSRESTQRSIDPAVIEHYIGVAEPNNVTYLPDARRDNLLEQYGIISSIALNNLLQTVTSEQPLRIEERFTENRFIYHSMVTDPSKRAGKAIITAKSINANTTLTATAYHDTFFDDKDIITDPKGVYAIDVHTSFNTPVTTSLLPPLEYGYTRPKDDQFNISMSSLLVSEFAKTTDDNSQEVLWQDTRIDGWHEADNVAKIVASRGLFLALLDPTFHHPRIHTT